MQVVEYYVDNNDLYDYFREENGTPFRENEVENAVSVLRKFDVTIFNVLFTPEMGLLKITVASDAFTVAEFTNPKHPLIKKHVFDEKSLNDIVKSNIIALSKMLSVSPQIVEANEPRTPRNKHLNKYSLKKVLFIRPGSVKVIGGRPMLPTKGTPHGHKYDSAGHWRAIKGFGKNQDGDYLELNRTWVKSSIKGTGEYISKNRIVKFREGLKYDSTTTT